MPDEPVSVPSGWAWWSVDLTTMAVSLAPELKKLVEPNPTVAQLLARVHPDDRKRVEREYQEAVRSVDAPVLIEFRFTTLDGHTHRFANASGVTRGADGRPTCLSGHVADLGHARGDAMRLFRMQKLYRVLLSVNHAMVDVASDQDLLERTCRILVEVGQMPFASAATVGENQRVTRLAAYGEPKAGLDDRQAHETDAQLLALLPSPPTLWVSNDLRTAPDAPVIVELKQAGYVSACVLPLVQSGRLVASVMIRGTELNAFTHDEVELLAQLAEDVSFAWSKLGQAQRFRALFEEASDAMFVVDASHSLVDVNQAAARLLGYTRDEMRTLTMSALTPDEDPLRWPSGTKPQVRQRSLRRKNGTFVPVEVSKRLVGEGLMQVIVRDLTERKRLETQLVLADRLVSLGTLASGVAHELNNPLSWIISNLSQANGLLIEMPASPLRTELTELVTESLEGAHRIVSVVSDLKTFTRPDSPVARVSLHRVIERSVQVLGIQARYRGKLVKQLEAAPDVIGTEAQLSQVFINLLLNAVQALPEGRPEANEVTIACFTGASGEAVVEVRDTGCGIAAETLPRIFDPFFTTKAPGLGTGLGLSVTYNIVTGLGGRIEVKSTSGEGSTFRVVLPAAKP